ncbi:MAG: 50S ribosomal protein L22 [Acidimicrobiales bacterium]
MAVKTNERPGTRAVLRYCRMSSYKVREVLDLVRGVEFTRAVEILDHTDRAAAEVVAKLVRSAAANAEHNDGLDPEELYVVSAFADEGTTLKRWRPRARGRATRIRKRTCHITVVLARMPEEKLARRRARAAAEATDRRARRVAGTRRQARAASGDIAEERATRAAEAGPREEPVSDISIDTVDVAAGAVGGGTIETADTGAADETTAGTVPGSDDGDSGAVASGEDTD